MDRIRDLTATDGRTDELVTSTSGGLFDTQYLSGDPPASYLEEYEQPQYVLRNKKSGVSVSGEAYSPDSDHQALAFVTDRRVFFLVGDATGDHLESVQHDEIVEARAESSGLTTSALTLETADSGQFQFPCRGDVSEVAAFVDDAAQTWANASRLVDEASEQIEASREFLDSREFTDARAVLDDVTEKVDTARERVSSVGDGAAAALDARAGLLLDRLHQLEQEIAAMKGAHHHAAAQEAWKADHDFERAAREYERGADEYERALDADGTTPSDASLRLRLRGLVKEREVLRTAPMADARAAREVAMATDDPDEAAREWETALTCYREAVTLDWGQYDRGFVVQREHARERAGEATTEAIDSHVEAGEEWVTAGDKIVSNGRRTEARQAYERAENHFGTARDIARELAPSRVDDIEARLRALEQRRTGEVVPSAESEESALSVEAVADQLIGEDQHDPAAAEGRHTTLESESEAETETAEDPTPAIQQVEVASVDAVPTISPSERLADSIEPTPVIRSRPDEETDTRERTESGDSVGSAQTTTVDTTPAVSRADPVTERETHDGEAATATASTRGASNGGVATRKAASDTASDTPSPARILESLRELDDAALTELVADVWETRGWSTTVFSATTKAVYDVVALRTQDGEDEQLLLWTVHRPDDGALGPTDVRRCATTRDSSRGADRATLVTTGTLTNAARASADDLDVTVVDGEELAREILSAELTDRLE